MGALEEAIAELEQARNVVEPADVRTKLDSIIVSLIEMIDTEAGEPTDAEEAFADVDFTGTTASFDNLAELEGELAGLAERTNGEAGDHLEAARQRIASYRIDSSSGGY